MSHLSPNFKKRDCLLPPGCKDLIDVLNLNKAKAKTVLPLVWEESETKALPKPKSPKEGTTMELPEEIKVKDLADAIGVKIFLIIADLMQLGVFTTVNQKVRFDLAAKVVKLYGIIPQKAG